MNAMDPSNPLTWLMCAVAFCVLPLMPTIPPECDHEPRVVTKDGRVLPIRVTYADIEVACRPLFAGRDQGRGISSCHYPIVTTRPGVKHATRDADYWVEGIAIILPEWDRAKGQLLRMEKAEINCPKLVPW